MIAEGSLGEMSSPYTKAASSEKLSGLRGPLAGDRSRHFAEIVSRCTRADVPDRLRYEYQDALLFPLVTWPGVHLTRAIIDRGPLAKPIDSLPADLPLDPFV